MNDAYARSAGSFQVSYFGTTTLLIRSGNTSVLTDGFFSRPSPAQVLFGKIAPDPRRIAEALSKASIDRLDAVLVGHSHYDHALDAPEVARQTGSLLVGSASTAQIGQGWGLPQTQICILQPHQSLAIRDLKITFLPSSHSRPLLYPGEITRPLVPPAPASAYREGGSYSIIISTGTVSILVQESANFIPGILSGQQVSTIFLSVAQLSRQSPGFTSQYFAETALAVKAKRVIPIHWDNFQKPAQANLIPFPAWLDNTPRSIRSLQTLCKENQIDFQILKFGQSLEISA